MRAARVVAFAARSGCRARGPLRRTPMDATCQHAREPPRGGGILVGKHCISEMPACVRASFQASGWGGSDAATRRVALRIDEWSLSQ